MSAIPSYDERALLSQLASGDKEAFTMLYSMYLDNLVNYVYLFTRSNEISEEIAQDVFLKIWERRQMFTEVQSFKSYLFRMAKNRIINYAQREKVNRKVIGRLRTEQHTPYLETEHKYSYKEYYLVARNAIDALPPKRKEIFRLSMEEGLSLDEIAARLGISKSVVKKQLYTANNSIRDQLMQRFGFSFFLILFITSHLS